jgi:hypothetical protein
VETTYANPLWDPRGKGYGPKVYTTSARPEPYRGHLIYNRIHGYCGGGVWDIVKDGVCVSQCAGPNGARREVDKLLQEIQ